MLTDIGPVQVEVPRDRAGTFEPVIVPKGKRRLDGVDRIVLSLTARGLTTGEIGAHFAQVYGASASKDTISRISDRVIEEMTEWLHRPLDDVLPVVFIDAIMVKVRDGQVMNKPFYVAIGVTVNGERDTLGIWARYDGEGAKYCLNVLTEIKNRGVNDVLMLVCDGLKGLPEAVNTVWERTVVQTCVIHLLRNTFRYAARQDWDAIPKDLRPIYTAVQRGHGTGTLQRVRPEVALEVSGRGRAVGESLDRVRTVPGLRRGDPQDHRDHQQHRIVERPLPARCPGPGPLPNRSGRPQMPLPGHPITGPHRSRQGTMGHPMEGSAQRVRFYLRRAHHPLEPLGTPDASYTGNLTVPRRRVATVGSSR